MISCNWLKLRVHVRVPVVVTDVLCNRAQDCIKSEMSTNDANFTEMIECRFALCCHLRNLIWRFVEENSNVTRFWWSQHSLITYMNRDLKHRQRKRRRRRTAPWKNWVENVVYGGKIRELSAGFLWTTNFPCKQRKCEWSKCSKCLFTVCPKRSIAPCLCSSRAAPSSFSVFFTSELFSSANFSCQLSLLELGLVRSLRKWFQWHFPLGIFSLYAW